MAYTAEKLRAWYSHRQGLDGSLAGAKPAEVLSRAGWARSVGGSGPYLTLHSRAGTSREAADEAVKKLEIHELPAARNCTYVVPAQDFALALSVGAGFKDGDLRIAAKLGMTEKEIEKLCDAILKALSKDALEPDEIREKVGAAARSLGEEGKKKGMSTTLPMALGQLQTAGEIRRVPVNGRLDQQRYRYALWRPNPLAKFKLKREEAMTELARRYFTWIGPATAAGFQTFSGVDVEASQAAMDPLKLVPLAEGRPALPASRTQRAVREVRRAQRTAVRAFEPSGRFRPSEPGTERNARPGRRVARAIPGKGHEHCRDFERSSQPRHSRPWPLSRLMGIRHGDGIDRMDEFHQKE